MSTKSRQVALGGTISALCVALLFLGGAANLAIITPMVAGALIMLMAVEVGRGPALCAWVAISILALIVIPNRAVALAFALLYGHYPIAKQKLERLPSRTMEYVCKLLVFNAGTLAAVFVAIFVFGAPAAVEGLLGRLDLNLDPWLFLIFGNVLVGSFACIIYDRLLTDYYTLYVERYRQKLFGGAKWGS
ncbi:MAG: hypothetical protein FWE19_05765 [Oscillospiraceae bacterium]|nr:hypothetical protein [Oscillospiraceae bacterium]